MYHNPPAIIEPPHILKSKGLILWDREENILYFYYCTCKYEEAS